MNIMFFLPNYPHPFNGGIERVTNLLAEKFVERGDKCYALYFKENESNYTSVFFDKTKMILLDSVSLKEEIEEFIVENKINVVINQFAYDFNICNIFGYLKKQYNFKFFIVFHNNPFISKARLKTEKLPLKSIKGVIKKLLIWTYPEVLIHRYTNIYLNNLRNILPYCDYYVLLAKSYLSPIENKINSPKLLSIYNPRTYSSFFNINNYYQKEKIVLFVGRYVEESKCVSKSLLIWKLMERYGYMGWRFVLVGHGPDEKLYREMIKKMDIKNIEIFGKQDPLHFYQKSSIFIMTSSHEGWPMTLLEAKQNGVVPICFNTFLAATEIINNTVDGFVVEDGYTKLFIDKLRIVMTNNSLRKRMAENAIESTKKYSIENIASQWLNLMEQ